MDCPECGGPLHAYRLRGHEASICERCGRVGIEADHRGEGRTPESWDDALTRFYDRHVEDESDRSGLPWIEATADADPGATNGEVEGSGAGEDADDDDEASEDEAGDATGTEDDDGESCDASENGS